MTDVTLVMRRSAAGPTPALRLALTSPAVAGSVTLKAVATIDPPGQAVAVWSVDGVRIGTSVWTGSGREWQTEIAATLTAGTRIVQVAYGVMIAADSLTVQSAGTERAVVLSWVYGATPGPLGPGAEPVDAEDWPSGNGFGTTIPYPPVELAEAGTADTGMIMAQAFLQGFGAADAHFATWDIALPAGYVPGTLSLQPAGPCLILTRDGTAAAGDYEITATVDGETYGPLILRLT